MKKFGVSERRACRALMQPRATQRYNKKTKSDEALVTQKIIELATQYGRYGYRRITTMLNVEEFKVNHKRVERIWRQEGLKVPMKQPKRGRLWLADGSCSERGLSIKTMFGLMILWLTELMKGKPTGC